MMYYRLTDYDVNVLCSAAPWETYPLDRQKPESVVLQFAKLRYDVTTNRMSDIAIKVNEVWPPKNRGITFIRARLFA